MESTIWTALVGRYFQAAAAALDPANLRSGSFKKDQAAIKAVAGKDRPLEERARILAQWVIFYRAHRVAVAKPEANFAIQAAAYALPVMDLLSEADIPGAFVALRAAIAKALGPENDTKRSLIGLTSKLLWCRFPETAPIYDQFAANATGFLVKLLKAQDAKDVYRRGTEERRYEDHDGYVVWDPNNKKTVDCWYYKDYVASRQALYERCKPEIIRQIVAAGPSITTASPFQVFDKMLWLLGDHRVDYSLKGSGVG